MCMNDKHRVVVTGMGIVSALGLDEKTYWQNLVDGKSGIDKLKKFDVSEYRYQSASEVDSDAVKEKLKELNLRSIESSTDYAMLASNQALSQAGLLSDETQNIPVIFGTGSGPNTTLDAAILSFAEKGAKGVRPTTIPRCMLNSLAGEISMRYKLSGPNYVIVSACSSSTAAIGSVYRMIRDGYYDKVLTGGTDDMLSQFFWTAWSNLRVMSSNPDPKKASKPFDIDRDGFVMGAGAGAFMIESLESAQARNADIRAEIIGYGESSDASHLTKPNHEGQALAIKGAVESAGISPSDIGFINAHGTATKVNDGTECKSIRLALGDAAENIPVASNKCFFGHMIGAAGAVETIATILGLENGKVPGNINLDNPDPECDLNLVGKEGMDISSPIAMKNSFAFGGNNAVLMLKRWA